MAQFSAGTSTSYSYDALGNLIAVTLPNGDVLEYLVDGLGRRVGKKRNGVLERAWLWRGQLQQVAELDGAGNVVARYVYGEGVNVPDLVVTGSATYRLVKDHLGSVRLVVDVATGAVVQELAYDAWGRVVVDTAPGTQPFGFAGGLYDPDTGLVRFGARDYDAEVGRWTAKDPMLLTASVATHPRRDYASAMHATSRGPALVLALALAGCGARSPYMTPRAEARPIAVASDKATLVLARPAAQASGMRVTVLDDRGRFVGDSLAETYFVRRVDPGDHVLIGWAENTSALRATVEAGQVYFVEVEVRLGAFSPRAHLKAVKNGGRSWDERLLWLEDLAELEVDVRGGQLDLDRREDEVARTIRVAEETLRRYTPAELGDRTLSRSDGSAGLDQRFMSP